MPVLGAVVHLSSEPAARVAGLARLCSIPGLGVGELLGDRLPIVIESATRQEDKDRWTAVQAAPGLVHLELVFADFSDLVQESS